MTTKFFVDGVGNYFGGFDGAEPPAGAIEVPAPPADSRQIWIGNAWAPLPETIPDSVSSRQFRLQLRKPFLPAFPNGIRDQVLAYVATLPGEAQDAFEYSGSFVRSDQTMQAGFTAMGFTKSEIDGFFLAASKL